MVKGPEMASKGSIKGFSYSSVLVALLAIGGAYVYFDRTSSLNKFSVAVTEKLCDMLPNRLESTEDKTTPDNAATPPTTQIKLSKASSHNPQLINGASYNSKAAMQMRYEKLHDICNRYSDVMRPESLMQKIIPKMEAFKWHVPTGTAVCTPVGVGHKAIAALFERIRTGDMHDANMFQSLKDNFEGANRNFKKAIIVRHPMERLLSIYRKHFAAYIDPSKGGEADQGGVSFGEFIHLVVEGPKELADFISENKLHGESLGIDTGMVDSKGESAKWDSYWHQCGLCHPDFKPHYIMDFDHAKEDEEVLVEILGNKERAKEWLNIKRTSMVSQEEVIKHFYSQLTKEEIRGIYEKYRVDFELMGYSPDYFIQFGQDHESNRDNIPVEQQQI